MLTGRVNWCGGLSRLLRYVGVNRVSSLDRIGRVRDGYIAAAKYSVITIYLTSVVWTYMESSLAGVSPVMRRRHAS